MSNGNIKNININKCIIWVLTVILSLSFIYMGNRVIVKEAKMFADESALTYKAKVIDVDDEASEVLDLGGDAVYENTIISFSCEIKSGEDKGQTVDALQVIDEVYAGSKYVKPVEEGDNIVLIYSEAVAEDGSPWQFSDYYRLDKIIILLAAFMLVILIIGRWKGVNTLLSLSFTFSFVFLVFVPAVMAGYNAYLWSAITCVYTIVMTLILINGISRKTFATIIGCVSGTVIAAVGTWFMSKVMQLTGFVDEHSYYLTMLDTKNPIDLKAIIFAAIIIGAVGAIMDVAMDIASALNELTEHVPDISFGKLYKSGMSIGRDIMGTMANTLVLAYIGSSLTCIMILLTYSASPVDLLNREVIAVELLQAILGSFAILLTVPCTVIICGVLYLKGNKHHRKD